MKTIETPRTVIDLSYEASDGRVFTREEECIVYENRLFYNSFVLDRDKTKGALTKSNWQHYMYSFMQVFVTNPWRHAEYLQEEKFNEKEYSSEKRKTISTGFKLEKVKAFFVEAFLTNIDRERYRRMVQERNQRNRNMERDGFSTRESDALTYYELEYKDVSLFTLIDFMFSSGLLTKKDVTKKIKSNNDDDFEDGEYEGYLTPANGYSFFWYCFRENSTEAMDLAIKYLGVDLMEPLTDRRTNSYGGGTRNFQTDFITKLVCGSFSDSWDCVPMVDDAQRVKWLDYILEKDVPVKLFKFVKAGSVETKDAEYFFTGEKKENKIHFIYPSIEDLIKEAEACGNDSKKYMFKKNHKRVIELLKTKVGKNFLEANKDNKKDKYYAFAEQVCEMVKDIFCEYPEKKLVEGSYRMFEMKMIIKENQSEKHPKSDYYRYADELGFEFVLDVLQRQTEEKKTDVCILYTFSKQGWANDKTVIIDEINLKDYLDKPEKLAMELAFHLNSGLPLGISNTEKIKEIDLKLFNIEKQKEILAKEEEILSEEKKKASLNICPKKKNK